MNRDLGGSGAPTGPMNRDFEALWALLRSSEALTGPMDPDFGGSEALTGPIDRDFGTSRVCSWEP